MKRKKTLDIAPKNPDKAKRKAKKKVAKRKLRQEKSQHIPRPENFSVAGCGVEIYYDHLTFIPDLSDPNLTTEFMDKERVCKKCRKRYKLDDAVAKRRRKK